MKRPILQFRPDRVYQNACPALMNGEVKGELIAPLSEGMCGERSPLKITAIGKDKPVESWRAHHHQLRDGGLIGDLGSGSAEGGTDEFRGRDREHHYGFRLPVPQGQ